MGFVEFVQFILRELGTTNSLIVKIILIVLLIAGVIYFALKTEYLYKFLDLFKSKPKEIPTKCDVCKIDKINRNRLVNDYVITNIQYYYFDSSFPLYINQLLQIYNKSKKDDLRKILIFQAYIEIIFIRKLLEDIKKDLIVLNKVHSKNDISIYMKGKLTSTYLEINNIWIQEGIPAKYISVYNSRYDVNYDNLVKVINATINKKGDVLSELESIFEFVEFHIDFKLDRLNTDIDLINGELASMMDNGNYENLIKRIV